MARGCHKPSERTARRGFWIAAVTNDGRKAARANCRAVLSRISRCKLAVSSAEFSLRTGR